MACLLTSFSWPQKHPSPAFAAFNHKNFFKILANEYVLFLGRGEICWKCCHSAGRQKSWQPSPAERGGEGKGGGADYDELQLWWHKLVMFLCVWMLFFVLPWSWFYFILFDFFFGFSNNPKCQDTQTGYMACGACHRFVGIRLALYPFEHFSGSPQSE